MSMAAIGGWVVAILIAVISGGATWAGFAIRARAARLRRQDTINRRNIRLINYARALQLALEHAGIAYADWPDDLFDTDE